ncbi:MAG: flippase-like domain-containing protein [Gluconacetobacter diazotrophicus]|nr:flippase-like domain-containing protein [Gluconacetobacter diazotrophicus]
MSKATVKKCLGFALQLAVTAALLGWILHDPHKRAQMAEAFLHADWHWLAAGLAVYGGVEAMAVVRWKTLLRIQHFAIGWKQATSILFIGEFFLTFTPGLVGGDVARIYYLARDLPEKKVDAFTAVLMDRVMGMLSLMLLAATILGSRYEWLSRAPVAAGLVKVVATILGFGVVAVVASLVVSSAGWLERPAVPRYLHDLATAFGQFPRDWPRTVAAFATTLVSHLCYYASFCCAGQAVSRGVSSAPTAGDVFSLMPIENTLTALPVSFAGVGLRESLFQRLLHDLAGVDPGVGALIGSLGFATKALWALPGAVVFIVYGLARRRRESVQRGPSGPLAGSSAGSDVAMSKAR